MWQGDCHEYICTQKNRDLLAAIDEDSKLRKRERRTRRRKEGRNHHSGRGLVRKVGEPGSLVGPVDPPDWLVEMMRWILTKANWNEVKETMDGQPFYINFGINRIHYTRALVDTGCLCFATISRALAKRLHLPRIEITPRDLAQINIT